MCNLLSALSSYLPSLLLYISILSSIYSSSSNERLLDLSTTLKLVLMILSVVVISVRASEVSLPPS